MTKEVHIILCDSHNSSASDLWMLLHKSVSRLGGVKSKYSRLVTDASNEDVFILHTIGDVEYNGYVYIIETIDSESYIFLNKSSFSDPAGINVISGVHTHDGSDFERYLNEYKEEINERRHTSVVKRCIGNLR